MKLSTVENVIERSGDLDDEATFSIALTAKTIEVLSSQIYKDAQTAILRELGTNAADSHIEAGKRDLPFDVTLPNYMSSELVIRDYGVGMSYEKAMHMYRTYFGSDKTHSNEVTGCLGLGCLLKGQPIVTIDGMCPIDELKIGDLVMTHKGRFRRVIETMSRPHKGRGYEVHLSQTHKPLVLTDEHPILISDSNGHVEWKKPWQIIAGYHSRKCGIQNWNSYAVLPSRIEEVNNEAKWRYNEAKWRYSYSKGGYLLLPITKMVPIELDTTVYNVTVEEDDSYVSDFVLHNSKSPLAYTDQFTVTSWYNSEKSVYTVYKNEKGLPCINRIYHAQSDEPRGVEVRLSIKLFDFGTFRQKALEVYRWFKPCPNLGIPYSEFPRDEILYRGDDWILRKSSNKLTVVMGNVAYNVDRSDLGPIIHDLDAGHLSVMNSGPIFYVGIGDVDIAASRESLKFDGKKTFNVIKRMLIKMTAELLAQFNKSIADCKTHWDARKVLVKAQKVHTLGDIIPANKIAWNGIPVQTIIPLTEVSTLKTTKVYAKSRKFFFKPRRRYASGYIISTTLTTTIRCDQEPEIFVVDSKKGDSRIRYYLRSHNENTVIYLLSKAESDDPSVELANFDQFIKDNYLPVNKTSTLPDPPRATSEARRKPSDILVPHYPSTIASHWREKQIDFEKGGIYVEVYGNTWTAGHLVNKKVSSLLPLEQRVIKFCDIIGVRKRSLKDFEESPVWKRLDVYLAEYASDIVEKNAAIQKMAFSRLHNQLWNLSHFKITGTKGLFNRFCKRLYDLRKTSDGKLGETYPLITSFLANPQSLEMDVQTEIQDIKKQYSNFNKRYPLLKYIDDIPMGSTSAVICYVKLMDKKARARRRKTNSL